MSYYGSSSSSSGGGGSSWQSHNQKKPSSSSSSSSNQYSSSGSGSSSSNNNNNKSDFNSTTASLIAQFAQVHNLNTLAANLPALVTANALQTATNAAAATGYQWHSQNRLAQSSSSTSSSSTSRSNGSSSHHHDPMPPLLSSPPPPFGAGAPYVGASSHQQRQKDNNMAFDKFATSLTGLSRPLSMSGGAVGSNSSSGGGSNKTMMRTSPPASRFEGSTRGSSSRYESNRNDDRNSNDRSSSNSNYSNNNNNASTRYNTSVMPPVVAPNPLNTTLASLAPNPLLAQALLNQLAVAQQTSTNPANTALVAAIATQLATQQQQQLSNQQQQQKHLIGNNNNNNSSDRSSLRRSRSRDRERERDRSRSRSRSRSPTRNSSLDYRLGRNLSVQTSTNSSGGISNRIVIRRSPDFSATKSSTSSGKTVGRNRSSSINRRKDSRSRSPRSSTRSITSTHNSSGTTSTAAKRYTNSTSTSNSTSSKSTTNNNASTTSSSSSRPVGASSTTTSSSSSSTKPSSTGSSSATTSKPSTTTSTTTTNASTTSSSEASKTSATITPIVSSTHSSTSETTSSSTTTKPSTAILSQQQQLINRYGCKIPKYPLDTYTANVALLKQRYASLYVPSDFSNSKQQWHTSLPLNRQLKFGINRCLFHVMSKESHSIAGPNETIYEPIDADHKWTVKVMLMSMPSASDVIKRCVSLAEDNFKENRYEHPSKLIEFLVGNRGRHEPMALGGPWSPSLDGPNPATNTQTLINTAIRTVKALTGIDLTMCTQWFRFLDIQYNRNENYRTIVRHPMADGNNDLDNHDQTNNSTATTNTTTTNTSVTGGSETVVNGALPEYEHITLNEDRHIENTVIFLPNVWTLMPNTEDYENIVAAYKNFIENPPLISASNSKPNSQRPSLDPAGAQKVASSNGISSDTSSNKQQQSETTGKAVKESKIQNNESQKLQETTKPQQQAMDTSVDSNKDSSLSRPLKVENESFTDCSNGDTTLNSGSITIDSLVQSANLETRPEPTHHSKLLDLKRMRVDELRVELQARNLDTKGYKPQLLQRLKEALEAEKEKENGNENQNNDAINEDSNNQDSLLATTRVKQESEEHEDQDVAIIELDQEEEEDQQHEEDEANCDEIKLEVDVECDANGLGIDVDVNTEANNQGQAAEKTDKSGEDTTVKKSKVIDLKARPKHSRYEREKMYKLPVTPHIIVHPSATAKSSKFDCHLVTLSHLLDYCQDDNKECSFEVFLFAECFNDMMMRDHGYAIFKHLLMIADERSQNLKRKLSVNSPADDSNKKSKLDEDTTTPKTTTTTTTSTTTSIASTTKEADSKEKDAKSQSSSSSSTTTTISLAKSKPKTVYPELLLAFTYFDVNRASHMLERDLEDLLFRFGPFNLTRSKLKPLLKKLPIRDGLFNYRALTDKSIGSSSTPLPLHYKLPADDEIVQNVISFDSYVKRIQGTSCSSDESEAILVDVDGTTVDVVTTLKNLEKAETSLTSLDLKLKDSLEEIERLKSSSREAERQKQKYADEANEFRKRYRDEQRANKDLDEKYLRLKSCISKAKSSLNRTVDDISDVLKKNHPPTTSSSTSSSQSKSKSSTTTTTTTTSTTSTTPSTAQSQSSEQSKSEQQQQQSSSKKGNEDTLEKTLTNDTVSIIQDEQNKIINEDNESLNDGVYNNENDDKREICVDDMLNMDV